MSIASADTGTGHRLGWRLWLLAGFLASATGLIAILGFIVAVLGATLAGCQAEDTATAVQAGPAPSASALREIPPDRLRLYEQAGARFDIDWTFLASIGAQECNNGQCAGANSSGCAGPMQIAYVRDSACSPGPGPTLWERYAVSVSGGIPDIDDPADAIFTAARILRQDMGAPPTGGSYQSYYQAACHYYGACADAAVSYAAEVMARAVQYGFTGPGTPAASSPQLAQPVEAASPTGCSTTGLPPGQTGASAIVSIAAGQLGQTEHPPGSDCTVYGPCEEWCSLFVTWVWQHAGVPLPGPTALYGYSGSLYTWTREHDGTVLPPNATPSPGDAVLYGQGPDASVHVGIVERVLTDGEIVTIEGNYAGRVSRVGPFQPADATAAAGEAAPIYAYAQPPAPENAGKASQGV